MEMSSYQIQPKFYRYHLVIPKIPWESPSMQDMVGGDNKRTPVIFKGVDIYRYAPSAISWGYVLVIQLFL